MRNQYTEAEKTVIKAAHKDWDEQAKNCMRLQPFRDKSLRSCIDRHLREAGLK